MTDEATPRVLIAEPSLPVCALLRKYLESSGFAVRLSHYVDEAVHAVAQADLVFTSASGTFDGETLCRKVKSVSPHTAVVLLYPPTEEDPSERAAQAGADSYLVGPLKRGTVVSTARTMVRLQALKRTVERQARDLERRRLEPPPELVELEGSGEELEFFKRHLLMEVKRARRYQHPLAFLVVALDGLGERLEGSIHRLRAVVMTEALAALVRCVRDIDLVLPFSGDRLLVFLPNTARDGALVVAGRLHEQVGRLKTFEGLTASVGVAAVDPKVTRELFTFSSLLKEANEAVRRAQSRGGDRIEANAPVQAKKRDRVSLG